MKVVITGSNSQLAKSLLDQSKFYTFNVQAFSKEEVDVTCMESVQKMFFKEKPDLLINTAAYTKVDEAEKEAEQSYRVNDLGVENLAVCCEEIGIPLFHISTDYVFDGSEGMYLEDSLVNPHSVYGASKLAGEISAKNNCSKTMILRTAWLFSEYGNNFLKTMIQLARKKSNLGIVNDQKGSPTSAIHLADALFKLVLEYQLGNDVFKTYHFTGAPYSTWFDFAGKIFEEAVKVNLIKITPQLKGIKTSEYPLPATRPADSRLDCSKIFNQIPSLENDWRTEVSRICKTLKEQGFK